MAWRVSRLGGMYACKPTAVPIVVHAENASGAGESYGQAVSAYSAVRVWLPAGDPCVAVQLIQPWHSDGPPVDLHQIRDRRRPEPGNAVFLRLLVHACGINLVSRYSPTILSPPYHLLGLDFALALLDGLDHVTAGWHVDSAR